MVKKREDENKLKKTANRLDRLKVSVFNKIINIINLVNYSYLIFSSLSSLIVIPSELLLMLRVRLFEPYQKVSAKDSFGII